MREHLIRRAIDSIPQPAHRRRFARVPRKDLLIDHTTPAVAGCVIGAAVDAGYDEFPLTTHLLQWAGAGRPFARYARVDTPQSSPRIGHVQLIDPMFPSWTTGKVAAWHVGDGSVATAVLLPSGHVCTTTEPIEPHANAAAAVELPFVSPEEVGCVLGARAAILETVAGVRSMNKLPELRKDAPFVVELAFGASPALVASLYLLDLERHGDSQASQELSALRARGSAAVRGTLDKAVKLYRKVKR